MTSLRALFLLAVFGVAACSVSGPVAPPMSPYEISGRYGYRDVALAENRVEITYVGQTRNSFGYTGRDSASERQVGNQAFDFALWRAAQLAQARGYRGFVVLDSRTDLRTRNEPGYSDDRPFGFGGFGSGSGGRFGTGIGFGSALGSDGYSSIHAIVTATIVLSNGTLANSAAEKYYDAAAVIAQARATYPGAEGAPTG